MEKLIELEVNGYGTFGSIQALKEAITRRIEAGISPTGEAEILLGATIIREDGSIRLTDPRRDYPFMTARVGPTGKYAIYFEKDRDYQGPIPEGWQEDNNP